MAARFSDECAAKKCYLKLLGSFFFFFFFFVRAFVSWGRFVIAARIFAHLVVFFFSGEHEVHT